MFSTGLVSALNIFVILFFIVFSFFLLIGLYIFLKDTKNKINILFFIWCISFSIGCLGYMFVFWTESKSDVYFFMNIACIGYCTIWPIAVHFLLIFLKDKLNTLWNTAVIMLYTVAAFFIYGGFSGITSSADYTKTKYGWVDTPNHTILYPVYIGFVAVCTVLVVAILVKIWIAFHDSENFNKKKQSLIMLGSAVPSIVLGLFFNIVSPALKMNLPSIGFIFSGLWIFGVAYAIARYELLVDISTTVGKKLFEKSKSINISTDPNLHIIKVNTSFFDILGYDSRSINTMSVNDLFLLQDDRLSQEEIGRHADIEREVRIKKEDDSFIYANMQVLFSFTTNNRLLGLVFHFTDITSLKNQNEVLEQKVQERTQEILKASLEAERRLHITEQYTRKSVVDLIKNGEDPTHIEPEKINLAVMFTDIRGFTSITEKLSAEQIFDVLNHYFTEINSCIMDNKNYGEIDKIIGDEIMALFGTPENALIAAINIRKKLPELNASLLEKYGIRLNNGIGINFGEVVRGNIGSDQKLDLTVIGDIVNSASRIEQLTKHYGLSLLISDDVKNSLTAQTYSMRFIDEVKVKGRNTPTKIYEVYDYERDDIVEMKKTYEQTLQNAYELYKAGYFKDALALYERIESGLPRHNYNPSLPADPVLKFYSTRCRELLKICSDNPSFLETWEGIYCFLDK